MVSKAGIQGGALLAIAAERAAHRVGQRFLPVCAPA